VEALRRRSLLERAGQGGEFTLQPVVLECATERLVSCVVTEIATAQLDITRYLPLVKATAKDYVRRSQERLIGQPILERLVADLGGKLEVERQFTSILATIRRWPPSKHGYAPGNIVNLLRLLRGDLRSVDLSRLAIRQAFLQEVEAQDACLAGAHLSESRLSDAFDSLMSVALNADCAYFAAGSTDGEVRAWRVADHALILSVSAHAGGTWGVALSADGRLLATGGLDGVVRLWALPGGECLTTLTTGADSVYSVAISADGGVVASGSADGG